MFSSETTLIAFTICSNVLFVLQAKLFNGLLDDFIASVFPHGLGAEKNSKVLLIGTSGIKDGSRMNQGLFLYL